MLSLFDCVCLQGAIRYEFLGMYPAEQYFIVNSKTGVIRTYGDLKHDPLKLMSYTVSTTRDPLKMMGYMVSATHDPIKLMSYTFNATHDPLKLMNYVISTIF